MDNNTITTAATVTLPAEYLFIAKCVPMPAGSKAAPRAVAAETKVGGAVSQEQFKDAIREQAGGEITVTEYTQQVSSSCEVAGTKSDYSTPAQRAEFITNLAIALNVSVSEITIDWAELGIDIHLFHRRQLRKANFVIKFTVVAAKDVSKAVQPAAMKQALKKTGVNVTKVSPEPTISTELKYEVVTTSQAEVEKVKAALADTSSVVATLSRALNVSNISVVSESQTLVDEDFKCEPGLVKEGQDLEIAKYPFILTKD